MMIGHTAVALGAKKVSPATSLGTLLAAAAMLDLIWPFLIILGIEHVTIAPGDTAFTPLDFVSYPWSHSLLMAVLWGIAFGAVYFAIAYNRTGAIVCAALVPSHWLLDWISHRPDLPLIPGSDARYGLGLWNSVPLTMIVELLLFAGGVWVYVSTTRARDHVGSRGLFAFLAVNLVLYAGVAFGPPPPSVSAIAATGIGQFLFIAFAAWIDRHRSIAT